MDHPQNPQNPKKYGEEIGYFSHIASVFIGGPNDGLCLLFLMENKLPQTYDALLILNLIHHDKHPNPNGLARKINTQIVTRNLGAPPKIIGAGNDGGVRRENTRGAKSLSCRVQHDTAQHITALHVTALHGPTFPHCTQPSSPPLFCIPFLFPLHMPSRAKVCKCLIVGLLSSTK